MISNKNYQHSELEKNKGTLRIYYHALTLINILPDHRDTNWKNFPTKLADGIS